MDRKWDSGDSVGIGLLICGFIVLFCAVTMTYRAYSNPRRVVCIEDLDNRLFSELALTNDKKKGENIYGAYLLPQNKEFKLFDVINKSENLPEYMLFFEGYTNSNISIRVYKTGDKGEAVAHYKDENYSMFFRDCKIKQ